jgi:hypothetical protein
MIRFAHFLHYFTRDPDDYLRVHCDIGDRFVALF